ncbi:hypothetical protein IP91_04087 [Pseudoduganella lurida]|uniref:Uncharacterized protein n=1 Tax=Pseudoduganella lurida TaxID=1036180 RepID=A0A562R2F8_9BURK|nr:hypothetical protein [Pseudoduganella lurida]TWI62566.1 hypothetical protein IP91_04087 [Pseudoduganella lurida]
MNKSLHAVQPLIGQSLVNLPPFGSCITADQNFPCCPKSERVVYVSVSVPPPQPPDTSEWGTPSTIVAVIALVVSLGVPIYTWLKDKGDKKKSVEDDYWLRQVVGPVAIEPLLKNVIELIGAVPADAISGNFSLQNIHEFHEQYLKKLATLAVNANSLQIIDGRLAAKAAVAIDEIQELMIDYCYHNEEMSLSGNVVVGYEKDVFQDSVRKKLVDLVTVIRDYQVKKVVH